MIPDTILQGELNEQWVPMMVCLNNRLEIVLRHNTGSFTNMLISHVMLFFFFQAEDGIRDVAVTGVQTCALPILVDPKDSDTVYVCVPGKLWSDSEDRGVYKTTDGGKTWNKILKGPNPSTGCSMISMNSGDPKVLFAGMWDFRRKGWTFRSGGESPTSRSGSGFFKTTDGGRTWQELDEQSGKGLPAKPWGRIAVAIAPSKPDVVYAMIETTRSALFRSDDGGKTWHEGDRSNWMVWRPFYFANLIVDPKNENKIYKPDLTLIMSEDGGESFSGVGKAAHGG